MLTAITVALIWVIIATLGWALIHGAKIIERQERTINQGDIMSTETQNRIRLARDIFMADNRLAQDPARVWEEAGEDGRYYAYAIADGLLSLGYVHSIVHQCCVDAEAARSQTAADDLDAAQLQATAARVAAQLKR